MLCSICSGIDLSSLLFISTTQSFESKPCEEAGHSQNIEGQIKHHDDIFGIRSSANNGCELCAIIIKSFNSRRIEDENVARGMPIVLSSDKSNKLRASFESPEGLLDLCGFDVYIDPGK
jgi:hypothetical protein